MTGLTRTPYLILIDYAQHFGQIVGWLYETDRNGDFVWHYGISAHARGANPVSCAKRGQGPLARVREAMGSGIGC